MKNWFTQRSGWKLRIKLLILLFGYLTQSGRAQTCERQRDSLALVALYNSTNGPNWSVTWDLNQPINAWYGVELNDAGCLRSLILNNNGLKGSIPPEIGNFENVLQIKMDDNALVGSLPDKLYDLALIETLSLLNNQLSGELSSIVDHLKSIGTLNLMGNQFSGPIPKEIGNLHHITWLGLNNNQFSGEIPHEIGQLTTLGSLWASFNQLSGPIPEEFGNMVNLSQLTLSQNNLSGGIPSSLGNLPNLTFLYLDGNNLTGEIPATFSNLQSMHSLFLHNNNLEGCYPEGLCYLALEDRRGGYCQGAYEGCRFNLRNNLKLPWQGDFSKFCAGESQTGATCDDSYPYTLNDRIRADCSCAGDTISCRNQDSVALVALYDATDGPNWTVSWDLNQPMNTWYGVELNAEGCVQCIDMDGVFDCGEAGSDFPGNNLNGIIPPEIGDLSSLQYLILNNNHLSGSIPPQIGNLTNLVLLNLSSNNLSGNLPSETGDLSSMKHLKIASNQISGQIPGQIGNLINAEVIDLRFNQLSGPIPPTLGNLKKLYGLTVGFNQLSGPIPASLSGLSNINWLDLSNNDLSGEIPNSLGDLTTLRFLGIGVNQLIGPIPASFASLNLINIQAEENQLSGEIPAFFGDYPSLQLLSLRDNNFTGCFPENLLSKCNITVDATQNPELPWQGDFSRFCAGESQTGAPCDDGDPNTINDQVQSDCRCKGSISIGADCDDAIIISDTGRIVIDTLYGPGKKREFNGFNCFNIVGIDSETNSKWFEFYCDSSKELNFTITPLNNADDIDFVFFELPNGFFDCDSLIVLRCMASSCAGPTGLRGDSEDSSELPDCKNGQDGWLSTVWIERGKYYGIAVNNFTGSGGFILDFNVESNRTDCNSLTFDIEKYEQRYAVPPGERLFVDLFADSPLSASFVFNGYGSVNQGTINLGPVPGQFSFVLDGVTSATIQVPFEICSYVCRDVCANGFITIEVNRDCFNEENFNLPNILFPDGPAGTNRYFIVETTKLCADLYGESTTALRVFDRWGKIIYRDEDYQNTWSGTDQSGAPLPAGTYYYVLNVRHERGMEQVTGYITLLR